MDLWEYQETTEWLSREHRGHQSTHQVGSGVNTDPNGSELDERPGLPVQTFRGVGERNELSFSPAFQFYTNDWLSSLHITLMTPAQEGAYIRLLAHAWNSEDCGLPDDDQELSVLSRLGEEWFKGGSTVVKKCFILIDGRLFNERLLKERKKQEEWRTKSIEGGKKSAKVRWGHKKTPNKGGYKMVKECLQPNGNSSSSSSSSLKKEILKKSQELLSLYPGNGNGNSAMKSIFKLLTNPPDELLPCSYAGLKDRIERYVYEIKRKKTDKEFIISCHNFFGREARWKDDRPKEKKTVW
ncbi:MAG: DUF1376 domain-containing protein [Nitrospiria bacterium]